MRLRTTKFYPNRFSPAIYTRGNGQGSLVWSADWPAGRYTQHAIRSTILAFSIIAGLRGSGARYAPHDMRLCHLGEHRRLPPGLQLVVRVGGRVGLEGSQQSEERS